MCGKNQQWTVLKILKISRLMKVEKMKDNNEVEILEDEKEILLDHDYDGIRELDNPLPSWWVTSFILTIVFAVPYYAAHTFFGAQSIQEELSKDMGEVSELKIAYEKKQGGFNLAGYQEFLKTKKANKIARKTYKRKCKACHGASGEGGIGPNLADEYWLHGNGSLETIYNTINKGVVDKGMAAWGEKLGKKKMYAVLKYVEEFKGTKPENAKAPQGNKF
jgi:cytochrome c oxidase cbb3-type subunit 3